METKLILVPSQKMDNNQKPGRDEHTLIRMPKVAREVLDPGDKGLVVEGKSLKSFIAYADDVKKARIMMLEGDLLDEVNLCRTCFVSTQTFKQLGGEGKALLVDLTKKGKVVPVTFKELLIGTDPELLIMAGGKIKHADSIPGFSKDAQFGSDGAMAELRPNPANTVEGLINNIKKLLSDEALINNVRDYDWVSSCYYENADRDYPVGTHIHIDNPAKIAKMGNEARLRLFAVTNKILDELLTVPMIRLDGAEGYKRRARCKMSTHNGYNRHEYGKGYGFFGEWRSCNGHLEHRSLSGLVMLNPEICAAVFGTAKAIAEAVYKTALKNNLKPEFILPEKYSKTNIYNNAFKDWGKVPLAESLGCTTASGTLSATMNKSDRTEVSPKYIKNWLTKIRTLPNYADYSEPIENLGDILSSSAKVLDGFNVNMKKTWKD